MPPLTCWIISDGRTGTLNNCRGLAEALGGAFQEKLVALRQPWKTLSPWLRFGLGHAFAPPLAGPWPDILITAGRTPAVAALYVRRASGGRTICIHITSPGISPRHFDLVIAPEHDRLHGPNVVVTKGALHRVTDEKLAAARTEWQPRWAHLPRPWHGLLIGGSTRGLTLDAQQVAGWLQTIKTKGGSIIATASRRTDSDVIALLQASALPVCWLSEADGPNPYFGILACADDLYVTDESVSMLSEACFTGKPVTTLPLAGHNPKFARFNAALESGGYTQKINSAGRAGPAQKLDDMGVAVAAVKQLLQARGKLSQ